MAGAATEFQIHKIWEWLQHLALLHKKLGAEALEASNKLQAIVQGLGEEMNALGRLPQGMEQAQQHAKVYFNWFKPQIEKVRYGQELAQRMHDRMHYVHPA
eukprot:7606-Karenia_brevis.AAC.1